jgi:hypothetical protein
MIFVRFLLSEPALTGRSQQNLAEETAGAKMEATCQDEEKKENAEPEGN